MRFFSSNQLRHYQIYELKGYFPEVTMLVCFNNRGQKIWTRYIDAQDGYDLTEDDLIIRNLAED